MMSNEVIIAHAEDEENEHFIQKLDSALKKAGYNVIHRGKVLVGESFLEEFNRYLSAGCPVVACCTIKAMGTGWALKIISAAQSKNIDLFTLKMEEKAYTDNLLLGDNKMIDCYDDNFENGIKKLIESLEKHYPLKYQNLPLDSLELLKPEAYVDQLTCETQYDEDVVASYREKLRDEIREKYPQILTHKTFLKNMGFLVTDKLTLSGVLLFNSNLNKYSPMAITKCSIYNGTEISSKNALRNFDFIGSIQHQIEQTYSFVLSNIEKREKRQSTRVELQLIYQYPTVCIREMIANALCHRDYSIKDRAVQVRIFSNRIEIGSPGIWCGRQLDENITYTLEELKCEPRSRNPSLTQALYNVRLFEGRGEGISSSIQECKETDTDIPTIKQEDNMVYVMIYPRPNWDLHFAESIYITDQMKDYKISLAKLPSTSHDLFGREKELEILDKAWDNPQTNIVSIVAFGGTGKTALVNAWLNKMAKDNYKGAERVLGWSFYSQGTSEDKQASADQFIASALGWFGDPNPNEGSPWDKGERLAELVKTHRTLLILDGLEPLQYPPGEIEGRLRNPSIECLLKELAHNNKGLCIITTRIQVDDIKGDIGDSVGEIELENLSPEDGARLLETLGVDGIPVELKEAVVDLDGHALALTLLGTYLKTVYRGDIRRRKEIPKLTDAKKQGAHTRRVMESYEEWFKDKPELSILLIMGLFDRPAEGGAIEAIREAPIIEGLTSKLHKITQEDWQFAINNLRSARLINEEDPQKPNNLDCHPLIREHFSEKLKNNHPRAWKEANRRLFDYYRSRVKEFPDSLEEMSDLYAAMSHGCKAGDYQLVYDEVYRKRIHRGDHFYSTSKLGAFGAELTTLAHFFETPWHTVVSELETKSKAFLMRHTGYCLRALGKPADAAIPMETSLKLYIELENWKEAAANACNQREMYQTIGNIEQSLEYADRAIELAEKSTDSIQQVRRISGLADALHQAGRLREATSTFCIAEDIQKKNQPDRPFLYGFQGFQHCDLLLDKGNYNEVQNRISKMLEWKNDTPLVFVALQYLCIGRAYMLQAQEEATDNFSQAKDYIDTAVIDLRQAGYRDHIPRALLARAELNRLMSNFQKSIDDLEETMTIATRGEMGLHQADCYLEYIRLYIVTEENDKAHKSLDKAADAVEKMGYHLRDPEVLLTKLYLQLLEHKKEDAKATFAIIKKIVNEMDFHRLDIEVNKLETQSELNR